MGYLFENSDFKTICMACAEEREAIPQFAEKDYWVSHVISSLDKQGLNFELKGGTSLSKGWGVINRFSEDVDIHVQPPAELQVYSGKNQNKEKHVESRLEFYKWIASKLEVPGTSEVRFDRAFSDSKFRNGGIVINYPSIFSSVSALKPFVFLEVGFAEVEPNEVRKISSWVYEKAREAGLDGFSDKSTGVKCYLPQYTLVEKLSAIETKYRQQQESKTIPENFIRHYYDVYQLLQRDEIKSFTKSPEFEVKKAQYKNLDRFWESDAFFLSDKLTREAYTDAYDAKRPLYYKARPEFEEIIRGIGECVQSLKNV